MKTRPIGWRDVAVGAILLATGWAAGVLVDWSTTTTAFAQHEAKAGIHQDQRVIDTRLDNLESSAKRNEEAWVDQRKVNQELLSGQGRLMGAINTRPEETQ